MLAALASSQNPGGVAIDGPVAFTVLAGILVALLLSVLLVTGWDRRRQAGLRRALHRDVRIGCGLLERQVQGCAPAPADPDAAKALADAQAQLALAQRTLTQARRPSLAELQEVRQVLLAGLAAAAEARRS